MDASEVKNVILKSFHEKTNSHAFLLVTNNVEKTYKDVIDIIKIVNCDNDGNDNCNICNTIDKNTNPDVIIVGPDGKEIKVDAISGIIDSFSTKPLINKYSIYVVNEADKLNVSSANKLLKFLEEPEPNIIGFFITDKLQGVIPTIRSRCEIYNYRFGSESLLDLLEISESEYAEVFDITFDLLKKLNDYPKYLLMLDVKQYSDLERNQIDLILNLLKKMYTIKYESILSDKYLNVDYVKNILDSIDSRDLKVIVNRIRLLDNIIEDSKFNLNKELMFNRLFIMWE